MNKAQIKWLILGLAGLAVILITGFVLVANLISTPSTTLDDTEKVSGQKQQQAKEEKYNAQQDKIIELGLDDIYEIVSLYDDTRELLYEKQDFKTVTEPQPSHRN